MFNIVLVRKIFELLGETKENVDKIVAEIYETMNKKMQTMFVLYVEERVKDDDELEKFVEFAESVGENKFDDDQVKLYADWSKRHPEIDFEEFWDEFDKEVAKLEEEIVMSLAKKLDAEQKKEVFTFIEKQQAEVDAAERDLKKAIDEGEDKSKKAPIPPVPVSKSEPSLQISNQEYQDTIKKEKLDEDVIVL